MPSPEQKTLPTESELVSKQLYIEHLASRLQAMERGAVPMHPVAYRLWARRLAIAVADYPEARLSRSRAASLAAVEEALCTRHFNANGIFSGAHALTARRTAQQLIGRLRGAR
jgi:hypothetical protein